MGKYTYLTAVNERSRVRCALLLQASDQNRTVNGQLRPVMQYQNRDAV
jgi:hypothetical protein